MSKTRTSASTVLAVILGMAGRLGRPGRSVTVRAIAATVGLVALSTILLPNSVATAVGFNHLFELPGLIAGVIGTGLSKFSWYDKGALEGQAPGNERLLDVVQGIVQDLAARGGFGSNQLNTAAADDSSGSQPTGSGLAKSGGAGNGGTGSSIPVISGGSTKSGSGSGGTTATDSFFGAQGTGQGEQGSGSPGSFSGAFNSKSKGGPGSSGPSNGASGPKSTTPGDPILDPGDSSAPLETASAPLGEQDDPILPAGSEDPEIDVASGDTPGPFEEPMGSDPVSQVAALAGPDLKALPSDVSPAAVPHPPTVLLLVGAVAGLVGRDWRKRAK